MNLTRWRLAALFAAVFVLFFAVAIYTPLHRHEAGNPYQCSLNNIDQAVAEAAVVVGAALVVLVRLGGAAAARTGRLAVGVLPLPTGRGPPSF